MFCAFDLIQLFAEAFRMVRAVHKFDFRHVLNEKIKPTSCSGRHSCLERIYTLSPSRRECYGTLNRDVLVNCLLTSDISTDNDFGVCS